MVFASLPHWVTVAGAQGSAQDLQTFAPTGKTQMGLTEPSPLPASLHVNFTIQPNQSKSQSNLAKVMGWVVTRNVGAFISNPLLSFLSPLRRARGFWKLLGAA